MPGPGEVGYQMPTTDAAGATTSAYQQTISNQLLEASGREIRNYTNQLETLNKSIEEHSVLAQNAAIMNLQVERDELMEQLETEGYAEKIATIDAEIAEKQEQIKEEEA